MTPSIRPRELFPTFRSRLIGAKSSMEAGLPQCRVGLPQHCLYFFPDPQLHGSLRPIFGTVRRKVA